MAKLQDDPKVQELLAKQAAAAEKTLAKAVKAETTRILSIIKTTEVSDFITDVNPTVQLKAVKALQKDLIANVKS